MNVLAALKMYETRPFLQKNSLLPSLIHLLFFRGSLFSAFAPSTTPTRNCCAWRSVGASMCVHIWRVLVFMGLARRIIYNQKRRKRKLHNFALAFFPVLFSLLFFLSSPTAWLVFACLFYWRNIIIIIFRISLSSLSLLPRSRIIAILSRPSLVFFPPTQTSNHRRHPPTTLHWHRVESLSSSSLFPPSPLSLPPSSHTTKKSRNAKLVWNIISKENECKNEAKIVSLLLPATSSSSSAAPTTMWDIETSARGEREKERKERKSDDDAKHAQSIIRIQCVSVQHQQHSDILDYPPKTLAHTFLLMLSLSLSAA